VVDLANLLITTGVTVALAATGHGAWSLAWGLLVGNTLSALVLFRLASSWPRPGFDRAQARALLAFGIPLAGASLLVFAMQNIDYVVTGSMLGVVALGLYVLAFNLAAWPVTIFSQVVRRVSFAAFARVEGDPEQRQHVLVQLSVLLAIPTLPLCALLALLALPTVTTVYGEKWAAAALAIPFLACLSLVRVWCELGYDFLVALGRPRSTLWLQGVWLGALAVALPVGATLDGIRGVAIGHAVVAVLLVLPAYVMVVHLTGISIRRLLRELARPILGCVLLAAVVLAVRAATDTEIVELLAGGALGLAVYVPVVWPLRSVMSRLDGSVG
jgi:PST family polysaccharide transporter